MRGKFLISNRGFLKLTKRTLTTYLILSTLFIGTGLVFLFNPFTTRTAEAAWFNDDWGYRQRVPIDTHTASETNVYNAISVDTATLTTDKLQADCDDLRFTKENGEILPYFIVSGCDSATTVINVGFDTMPIAPFNIYMYYGNPQASAGSTTLSHAACGNGCAEGTLASEEKTPAPTLYWKLDDVSVGTAEDSTANALDGTHNNTPTIKTEDFCISAKCLYFDGANNENVSKADDPKLDFVAADNFTVSAWVRRNGASSANNVIINKSSANIGSTYQGYKLYLDASGDFCFTTQDGTLAEDSACTSAVEFDDDKWHQVVGVKAATTSITLYVDGNQRAQDASIASTGSLANAGTFYAGVDSDGLATEWLGYIDEVKVFRDNTTRTAAQVKADFNARGNPDASATLGASNNQPGALSNGLTGYWKMDEASWTNDCSTTSVTDSSGNGNNGKSCPNATGVSTPSSGKFGNAPNLDGTDDYVGVASSTSLNGDTGTVSMWFNADTLGVGDYLFSNNTDEISIYLNPSSQIVTYYDSTNSGAYSFTTTGSWTHLAFVYTKGSSCILYINGVLTSKISGGNCSSTAPTGGAVGIGVMSSGASNSFDGKIDETRVYNRALSGAEVSQLYNFAPGPRVFLKMDEGTGTAANDSSGNGRTGTINGNPVWNNGKYGEGLKMDGTGDNVTVSDF